jgi:hypothetical protein
VEFQTIGLQEGHFFSGGIYNEKKVDFLVFQQPKCGEYY